MSITYSSTQITLEDGTYSLENIYENRPVGYTKIKKLGSFYEISVDLYVGTSGHPAVLEDSNISLNVLGELFQVYEGSEIRFGKKDGDKTTGGCYISCPNIKLVYGFGNTNKSVSGDLFLYSSIIKIWGFWGFFRGPTQRVEVIDCLIDGFGRIEGSQSILKNINFEKSHGKYGILSPKGTISEMSNLKVLDSLSDGSNRVSVYFNPTYAPQIRIVGGVFGGYDKLVYTETGSGSNLYIEFIDSEILDGYERHTANDLTSLYHKFTFNPIFRKLDGGIISGVRVVCKDVSGELVFDSTSDLNGEINEEITYYYHTGNGTQSGQIKTPHTLEITYNDITVQRTLIINKSLKSFPLYICEAGSSGGDINYTIIQNMLDTLQNNICTCVSNSETGINQNLTDIDVGIRNILSTLGEEINQNEIKIENSAKTMQLII